MKCKYCCKKLKKVRNITIKNYNFIPSATYVEVCQWCRKEVDGIEHNLPKEELEKIL